MNFSNLQYFVTVADELNVTKAAEKLYISQQSLSNQIIKLENELGVKLFVRNPGLKLTYAGDRLYKSARHILDLHNQMLSEIEDIKDNKKVNYVSEYRIREAEYCFRIFCLRSERNIR